MNTGLTLHRLAQSVDLEEDLLGGIETIALASDVETLDPRLLATAKNLFASAFVALDAAIRQAGRGA